MKFGVCCGEDKFESVAGAGYDYLEFPFCRFSAMTDEEFRLFSLKLKDCGLKSEACNSFFTPDIKLIGEDVNLLNIESYVKKGMERAAAAGCEVAVIGSGGARRIPENFDPIKAKEQFCEILELCGNIAGSYNIKIAIEPLNAGETNFINTVADGIDICRSVSNSNVGVLADFYHIYKSKETLEAVESAGDLLFHVHLARPDDDRGIPYEPSDMEACIKWNEALNKCGYNKIISFEAIYAPDFDGDIKKGKSALKIFGMQS